MSRQAWGAVFGVAFIFLVTAGLILAVEAMRASVLRDCVRNTGQPAICAEVAAAMGGGR